MSYDPADYEFRICSLKELSRYLLSGWELVAFVLEADDSWSCALRRKKERD